MRTAILAAVSLALVVPTTGLAASSALASYTGFEIAMDGDEITILGHPSPAGATDAQVTGDIVIERQGSSLVVYVDPESEGGPQLWSIDPTCNPATGNDVTEIRCAVPNPAEATAFIDLDGIDEEGSGRQFVVMGDLDTTFFGSSYDDYFQGGAGDDYIEGLEGDDLLFGGDGADEILGGDGADTIEGERGEDTVEGGAGPDEIDVRNERNPQTGEILDFAVDTVDCNDEDSRGSDNSGTKRNQITYDREGSIADKVTDCGASELPVNTARPNILSDPMVGIPVSGNLGTWTGKNLKYSYKWASCVNSANPYTDCKDVQKGDAKTNMTYVPKASDEGRLLLFSVFAINNAGEVEMTSNFSAPVTKPKGPANLFTPFFLSNDPMEGKPVKVNFGSWVTQTGDVFQYAIEACYKGRCAKRAEGYATAGGQGTYTPTDDDVDRQLKITVSGSRRYKVDGKIIKGASYAVGPMTSPIAEIGKVNVPASWYWLQKDKPGYTFTKLSEAEKWVAQASKTVPVVLNVVRVGLPQILSMKAYEKLRVLRQDLPRFDQSILVSTPDFGDSITGYPGMMPKVITLVVYDKMLDIDTCATAIKQKGWFSVMQGDALRHATNWLTGSKCPSWKVEWSSKESRDTISRVESVRIDESVKDGVTTSTIVVVASKPKFKTLFMDVLPPGSTDITSYPELPSLTWDGDIKALPGKIAAFQVWPGFAGTGGILAGGRYASLELFDVDGRRLSTYEFDMIGKGGTFDLQGIPISAGFSNPGTARLLLRVIDSSYATQEIYVDIPVRAPTGPFATLDGRCFTASGDQTSTCPAASQAALLAAEAMRLAVPQLPAGDAFATLRAAAAHSDTRPGFSNLTYSVIVANATFGVEQQATARLLDTRADCPWWNIVCHVTEFFKPKKAKAVAKPVPKPGSDIKAPKAPAVIVEDMARTLELKLGQVAAALTSAQGCMHVGGNQGVGCGPAFNASQFPANPGELLNQDANQLQNLDPSGLIAAGGLNLIGSQNPSGILAAGGLNYEQLGPAIVEQPPGALAIPTSRLINPDDGLP